MSSHFATGTKRRTPPSWCKKGMFVGVDPDMGPYPRTMNALVHFIVVDTDVDVDLYQLVHLSLVPAGYTWKGETHNGRYTVTVNVLPQPGPPEFTIQAILLEGPATLSDAQWIHEQPPGVTRWNTGELQQIDAPGIRETRLTLMA